MNAIDFVKTALKDYKVGAITVSSKYVVHNVICQLKKNCKYVIEYGAGDGTMTKELLNHLPNNGLLYAFELNKDFIYELNKIQDKRFHLISQDVIGGSKNLRNLNLPRIDAIVSSIPFTLFSSQNRERIIRNTYASLPPRGQFIVYQYSPLVYPLLKKYFRKVKISFEPRNFLPYFIMSVEK